MTSTRPDADAWLVDDRWSKAYPLSDETHIGRGMGASIILRDPVISRRHATVVKEGDAYVLHCYGAAGTQVNGHPVESTHVLVEGDKIEIAFTRLRYTCMAPTG
ncbi:MAG TPA: FHA domain-containing protein, partial [Gemmatimonadaceae bacterium]